MDRALCSLSRAVRRSALLTSLSLLLASGPGPVLGAEGPISEGPISEGPTSEGSRPTDSVRFPTGEPARETVKLPGVVVDLERECVDVEAAVCLDRGLLELVACTRGSKEHESIVTIRAKAMHVHAALLLLGLKPGHPAMREPVDERKIRWVDVPPRGERVRVSLVFPGPDGKPVERPIRDFIRRSEESPHGGDGAGGAKGLALPDAFLFAGSQYLEADSGPRRYVSDLSGNVISIATFGDELLCLPGVHTQDDGSLQWEVDDTHLPDVGSRVTLRIRPRASAAAGDVPAQLPDPDGKPGDATKPVQVYILAGQSNMVGMGNLSGARSHYTGVYLTADPGAPLGPLSIYPVGNYRIVRHGVHVSAAPDAVPGATASVYRGAHDPANDHDRVAPVRTEIVPLGSAKGALPSLDGPHTVVVRGHIDVPETGPYTIHPGYGDSSYNVTRLRGREVYRREPGSEAVAHQVSLEAGTRYEVEITYLRGGSTALFLRREELQGNGDLELVTKRDGKFPHLVDEDGKWTVRNDVHFHDARIHHKGSPLSPTSNGRSIGPELGFGHVLGTFHDERVLLIKTAMGNRALGFDFRPPSSGRNAPDNKWEGLEYRLMVEGVRKTLDQLEEVLPGYRGQGYRIAGFVWWQGHKDSFTPELIDEYETNLVRLIQDVRKEFEVPDMPAVVATVGFGGHRMADKFVRILEAQMAIADPAKHPELEGTVATVDTRDFWREVHESPANQDYHYNRNAETYLLVGDALGRAMVRLRGGRAEDLPQPPRPRPAAEPVTSGPGEADPAAAKAALVPIILGGMVPAYVSEPRTRATLLAEASGERPARPSQFLRGAMYRLTAFYRAAGVEDYEWRPFGPDLPNAEWEYHSFDPKEALPKEKGNRYRKVTLPEGMEMWYAPEFDAVGAGWRRGLPPFGQLGGQLAPLSTSCRSAFCRCSETPRTLWEKEVLLVRGTFDVPPLRDDRRYRIVLGGSAHVNAGEGYAIRVNGKLLAESSAGVGRRQGGQPRGARILGDFRRELSGRKVTIAAMSFLRYNNPRGMIPPRGHLTLWLEEARIPPVGEPARAP